MTQLTITKISRFTTGKDGSPLKTKAGKSYTRVVIQVEEMDKPLSGFENEETKTWDQGSVIQVEVEQKGEYWNFKTPKKEVIQTEDMKAIKEDIEKILLRLGRMMNGIDILVDRGNPKKNTAPDVRDAMREPRYEGDNVTSFDEPEEEQPPY